MYVSPDSLKDQWAEKNNHCFQAGLEPDLHVTSSTWGNSKALEGKPTKTPLQAKGESPPSLLGLPGN